MKRSLAAPALLAALGSAATAQAEISYSYVRGSYVAGEPETALGEQDGTGPEFEISYELMRYLHVFGGYGLIELDDFALETETLRAGLGFHANVSDTKSVFVNVAAVSRDVSAAATLGALSGDEDGYGVSIGYRETNDMPLEFLASVDYVEFDDSNYSDTSLHVGMQYEITPRFRVEGGVDFAGDDTLWKLGVRYYLPSLLRR